jgi:hypothetical protein
MSPGTDDLETVGDRSGWFGRSGLGFGDGAGPFPDIGYLERLERLRPGSVDLILGHVERRLMQAEVAERHDFIANILTKILGLLGLAIVVTAATILGLQGVTVASVTAFSITGVAVLAAYLGKISMLWTRARADEGQTQPND